MNEEKTKLWIRQMEQLQIWKFCMCPGNHLCRQVDIILWKYFYSLASIFVVSTKYIDPWLLEFVVSNITDNNQW